MTTVLKVQGLTKRFGCRPALAEVSFSVSAREFVAVVGHSGCGKSTLLNCIAGLEDFTGSVTVNGQEITRGLVSCGMVFQDQALFPWLDVAGNVGFGLRFMPERMSRAEARQKVRMLLEMMGLADAATLYPRQLSGGMQQRVAIARSLATDPSVLLMDEPFASLDAMTRQRLGLEVVRIWRETGKVVVFVTHSAAEAVMLSDRVVILHEGRLRRIEQIVADRPRSLADRVVAETIQRVEDVLAGLQNEGASVALCLDGSGTHRSGQTQTSLARA